MQSEAALIAEQGVLGYILEHPGFMSYLQPSWLLDIRCLAIANIISSMIIEGRFVGLQTVWKRAVELNKQEDCGGFGFISGLPEHAVCESKFKDDIRSIVEFCRQRMLQQAGLALTQGDVDSDKILARIREIEMELPSIAQEVSIDACMGEILDEMERKLLHPGSLSGLSSGLQQLDGFLDGLKPGTLTIIAARPSVGKSALAINICAHVAQSAEGGSCGIISLEMSKKEIVDRLWTQISTVPKNAFYDGCPKDLYDRRARASILIKRLPIHISDTCKQEPTHVLACGRRMHQQNRIKLLVIDYLQIIQTGDDNNRSTGLGLVTCALKGLARELQIPVIALSQLNRESDKAGRAPRLSELRDSGAIEQDADTVLILHRNDTCTDLYISKNRSGPAGMGIKLRFDGPLTLFTELPSEPRGGQIDKKDLPKNGHSG